LDPELEALETASTANVEEALIIPTTLEIGVVPTLPQDKLTPTPRGGFPKINGLSLKKLAGNITKDTKEVWNSLDGPIMLIAVAYAKPTKGFSTSYVARLAATITSVIGKTEDLTVTPSELIVTKFPTLPQPFAITGLHQNQADALVDKQCWSTPEMTFFAWPTTIPMSTYLMTLVGFVIPASPENETFVAGIVRARILEDTRFRTWILAESNRDNIPARVLPGEEANFNTESITASAIEVKEGGEVVTAFRIHGFPPSNNHDVMDDFITWLKTSTYYPSKKGIGRPKKANYRCIVCRGCDHPTGLCPFKSVPGFFDNNTSDDKKNSPSTLGHPSTAGNQSTHAPTPTTFSFNNIPPNTNRSRSLDPYAPSSSSYPSYGGRGYGGRGGRGRGGRGRGRGGQFRGYEWRDNTYDDYEEW
jgi:hypothetical protein